MDTRIEQMVGAGWFRRLYARVQRAAEEGDALILYALLSPFSYSSLKNETVVLVSDYMNDKTDVLKAILKDEGRLSNAGHYPPLIAAAYYGHTAVVELLLEHFKFYDLIDLETTLNPGTRDEIAGVTALWVAAFRNNLEVVEVLLKHRANVDYRTKSGSTPLRVACLNEDWDVGAKLLEAGANVNAQNFYGSTCLMLAAFQKKIDVVNELIEFGACVNQTDRIGNTAFHCAMEKRSKRFQYGDLSAVCKLLVAKGLTNCKNSCGATPLMLAAEQQNLGVILPMMNSEKANFLSGKETADAMDAHCAMLTLKFCVSRHTGTDLFWKHVHNVFKFRERNSVPREPLPAVPAYGMEIEATSYSELQNIATDQGSIGLVLQGLLTRERFWGAEHPIPSLMHHRYSLASMALKTLQFESSAAVLHHGLRMAAQNHRKDFIRYYQTLVVVLKAMAKFARLDYATISSVIEMGIAYLKKTVAELPNSKCEKILRNQCESPVLISTMSLLTIAHRHILEMSDEEKFSLKKLAYDLAKTGARTTDGQSALMLSVASPKTLSPAAPAPDNTSSSCEGLVISLIEVTDDLDALDCNSNTALHYMTDGRIKSSHEKDKMHQYVLKMLLRKAHPDLRNSKNQAPVDLCVKDSPIHHALRLATHMSLQCLTARAVRISGIPYWTVLHPQLSDLCHLH